MNIDEVREAGQEELGRCTNADYALIKDTQGVPWQTETLNTGEQVKRRVVVDASILAWLRA